MPDNKYTSAGTAIKLTKYTDLVITRISNHIRYEGVDVPFVLGELNVGNGKNIFKATKVIDGKKVEVDEDLGSSLFLGRDALINSGLTNYNIYAFEKELKYYIDLLGLLSDMGIQCVDQTNNDKLKVIHDDNIMASAYINEQTADVRGLLFNDSTGQMQHDALIELSQRFKNLDMLLFVNPFSYKVGRYNKRKGELSRLETHLANVEKDHWFITEPFSSEKEYCLMYGTNDVRTIDGCKGFYDIRQGIGEKLYEVITTTEHERKAKLEERFNKLKAERSLVV